MADCIDSRITTKCISRTGRVPQLRTWIWILVLQCLISFPCIFSKCLTVDLTVRIYPEGDFPLPYGQPLELICVAENYSSSDIVFTLSGKPVESEVINSTSRRLYIEKLEKNVYPYFCANTKTNKKCVSRVLVDSPPEDILDFKCISKNLEILNCSWTSPESLSITTYNLTFAANGNFVKPCVAEKVENSRTRYCVWNTTSKPRYRQQEEVQFFNLTACNVFGCNSQNFTINHYAIVKPQPPSELKTIKIGTHKVVLKWSISNNMYDFVPCGVQHKIQYQIAKIDNKTSFHEVDTSMLPIKNKTYKFNLTNLEYAHMQYEVRIYIKSVMAPDSPDFWSDFSYVVFYTASERPQRPPDTAAGAFDRSLYVDRRILYIYWKQLEYYEEAGANFTYKVLVSQDNKTQTLFPDKSKSLSYVMLNASLSSLDVDIWSFNINGSSVNSSHLYIPPERDIHSLGLTSFTKLAYENGTYELSWIGIKNIDNYTLFWCQHNSTNICAGQMDFAVLEPHKNHHVIDLPREHRYQFAISANNGSRTSGMVWAKCDISKEGFVMYRFNLNLNYDAPGKSFVTLRWQMECILQDGIITGFNISYCPIIKTSTLCDKSVASKDLYIPDPKQTYVTIENLLPFRTYQFTIAIDTIYGQKTVRNATAVLTTSEDRPTSPTNVVISNVRNDSLVISWDPPLQRNGNIGKYVIYNYDKEIYVDSVPGTDTSSRKVTLLGLQGFNNYSLSVQACNIAIGLCSKPSPKNGIYVRTRIGAPSRLRAPTVTNNPDVLKWDPPDIPGGTVDLYQIMRIRDDKEPEFINTTNLSYSLTHCDGVLSSETYQVRALNYDEDLYHGVMGNVNITERNSSNIEIYAGPWSEPSLVACRSRDGLAMILILMGLFAVGGFVYGAIKLYRKYRKMEDIKPVLPYGLGEPEKDRTKFTYPDWNPSNKDEKPSSDEMLLLPNSKSTVSSTDIKQKDDNCAASDHTDSTALSDSSAGPVDRQVSTSDDGSNSSLHLEAETDKGDDSTIVQEEDSSNEDTESSRESSPYFSDKNFKKNPTSGYVQPVVNPATGYVQSAPANKNTPQIPNSQPTTSSYVMAGLPSPLFTMPAAPIKGLNPAPSSGYVLPEEAQVKSMMGFPKLAPTAPKVMGPESLPTLPTLPPPVKPSADNSYIQLQSLDSLPSLKTSVRNTVPLKPPASNGYVSPGDVVINKHLNNMLSAGQLSEESAILDPTMSPDAYCRFSWSTDPANDNLHSLLADSPSRSVPKN
ncbi:unnamed protein product [Colias eurytheme]|nr:unnamed protein product [Colias eurytheme]